ncbi:MAG: hypothetical protein R3F61_06090 [Myxococcota bacterium]
MLPASKEAVIGGLYLMWNGNGQYTLGKLIETFVGAEGFELADIPDEEWPQREWKFCPWCGKPDPKACMNLDDPEACIHDMWE